MTVHTLRLTPEMDAEIRARAEANQRPISTELRLLLAAGLKTEERQTEERQAGLCAPANPHYDLTPNTNRRTQ